MKSEQKLLFGHLKAAGMQPVLQDDREGFTTICFSLAPGIEAECITRKPARNLVSTTLMVVIDLTATDDLCTYSLSMALAIAPVVICQTRYQLTLRLRIQSETKNHLHLINEGVVMLRATSGAVLGPALKLGQQKLKLSEAIETAVEQLQSLEPAR